jgi:hypothetical protein
LYQFGTKGRAFQKEPKVGTAQRQKLEKASMIRNVSIIQVVEGIVGHTRILVYPKGVGEPLEHSTNKHSHGTGA